ncbi:hypothetical protein ACP4OV_022579 [Aristida adscensionis]
MRSESRFRFVMLLIAFLLLGAELRGLCHGRGIPSSEVVAMVHDVESPPSEGDYLGPNKQRSPWSWRKRGGVHGHGRRVQDLSESKRRVPQGPNPLHN